MGFIEGNILFESVFKDWQFLSFRLKKKSMSVIRILFGLLGLIFWVSGSGFGPVESPSIVKQSGSRSLNSKYLTQNTEHYWVEVVQVRLEGQEHPGFRIAMDYEAAKVREALVQHFDTRGKDVVLSGESVLVENVVLGKEVSIDLFYRIQPKANSQSTCTLVGLDPSRHALSGGYRPALTQKLLGSWDAWVHDFSGNHLSYDHLVSTMPEGLAAYQDTVAILKAGIYAYESLMEEQEYLIDSLLRAVRRNPGRRKAIKVPLAKSNAEVKVLRDSLYNAKVRFRKSEKLLAQSNRRVDSLTNELGVQKAFLTQLNQSQKQLDATLNKIERMEQQLATARKTQQAYKAENARLEGQARELEAAVSGSRRRLVSRLRKAENEITDLERRLTHARREERRDRNYIFTIDQEKKALRAQLESQEVLLDSMRTRARRAEGMAIGLTRSTVTMQAEIDSLRTAFHNLGSEKRELLARQDSLLTEIDLLGPYSREAKARRRVYQEQLAILQDLERRLPAREQALNAREKLLRQREKYLAETDRTGSYTKLTSMLDSLVAVNAALRSQAEGGDAAVLPKPEASKEVYMSTLEIAEQVYPAFCLEREASSLAIREELIDYFREKMRLAPASRDPLSFQRVGLGGQRMTLTFDVSEQLSTGLRRVSCTFRLPSGEHLGPYSDEALREEAKQLLETLFP